MIVIVLSVTCEGFVNFSALSVKLLELVLILSEEYLGIILRFGIPSEIQLCLICAD